MRAVSCLVAAAIVLSVAGAAAAGSVCGTVSGYGTSDSGIVDRSEVFFPNSSPVVITGSVDLSDMVAGQALMVGLVNKPIADYQIDVAGWNYWENKDAWAHFVYTGSDYRVGLGDYVGTGGEIVQNWIILSGPVVDEFTLTIGESEMDLSVGSQSVPTKAYGTPHSYWASYTDSPYYDPSMIDPEFSNGAYLLAGAYMPKGGSADVCVTAAPVPLPAAALMGLPMLAGLAGLACWRRRRRDS